MGGGEGNGRSVRKAANFTAICEPIIYKMWEPRRLTILWASTACYMDSFYINFLVPRYFMEECDSVGG
jgi:hypothetical protein